MILNEYSNIMCKNGMLIPKRKTNQSIMILKCDKCEEIYKRTRKVAIEYNDRWGKDYCRRCLKLKCTEMIVKLGTKYLTSRSKSLIKKHASIGGVASQLSPNRDVESFTTKRWNNMTKEQRLLQVKRASAGLYKKLEDPIERKKHFEKVFKNSRIGYISKGQREIYEEVKHLGFLLEENIEGMFVDMVNYEKKLIIEFNGDFYHCNPRKYSAGYYNKVIKMTASEKWKKDRARRFYFRRRGYEILIVWESEWNKSKQITLQKILEFANGKYKKFNLDGEINETNS